MNLINACTKGLATEAKQAVNEGADINQQDSSGRTPLIEAAWSGSTEIVEFLLEKGANVDASDKSGFTALMRATEEGHVPVVSMLLLKGANVNCRGYVKGTTPLMLAAEKGCVKIIDMLLERGANINAVDLYEETALARAYRTNQDKAAELLESRGGRGRMERSSYSHADREIRHISKSSLPKWTAALQDLEDEEESDSEFREEQ
ncbi:MAG: ankyrin repeat domain-containing protein [Chitinispirillaceae bacterium]